MADNAKRRTQLKKLKDLLGAIDGLAAGLPSREDLARADATLAELADFIRLVRERLQHVPTVDDVGSVHSALRDFQTVIERVETNPALSLALGIEAPRRQSHGRPKPSHATVSLDEINRRFAELTIDQLRETLADERQISIAELQGIAVALGARAGSRLSRDTLVSNIVTKMVNVRGYRALGLNSETPPEPKNG